MRYTSFEERSQLLKVAVRRLRKLTREAVSEHGGRKHCTPAQLAHFIRRATMLVARRTRERLDYTHPDLHAAITNRELRIIELQDAAVNPKLTASDFIWFAVRDTTETEALRVDLRVGLLGTTYKNLEPELEWLEECKKQAAGARIKLEAKLRVAVSA